MAKTTIIKLTDDIDGGDADETISFSLDGRSYEIDLNSKNAAALRSALDPYVSRARSTSRGAAPAARRSGPRSASTTLFSQLDSEEKDRFRAWASMPRARRIGDARVQEWINAGRP
jgi:hypothetical protein